MISKTVNLAFEHCGIQLESNIYSGLITIRINDLVLDEIKSEGHLECFKEKNVVEIYPDVDELKEVIKALQQILPEEDGSE